MNPEAIFVHSNPTHLHNTDASTSHTNAGVAGSQQGGVEEEEELSDQPENRVAAHAETDIEDFRTVKRVLKVLKEGGMDVGGFLDALSWGNQSAVADPTTRQARTNLMHSERLAEV